MFSEQNLDPIITHNHSQHSEALASPPSPPPLVPSPPLLASPPPVVVQFYYLTDPFFRQLAIQIPVVVFPF